MSARGEATADEVLATFGRLDGVLSRAHDIVDDERTKFQARLRKFQRMGLPFGKSVVSGRSTMFTPDQVVQMGYAIELTDLGMSPEQVVSEMRVTARSFAIAVASAARDLMESKRDLTLLVVEPGGLDGLRGITRDHLLSRPYEWIYSSRHDGDPAKIVQWAKHFRRVGVVNMTQLVATCSSVVKNELQKIDFFRCLLRQSEANSLSAGLFTVQQVHKSYAGIPLLGSGRPRFDLRVPFIEASERSEEWGYPHDHPEFVDLPGGVSAIRFLSGGQVLVKEIEPTADSFRAELLKLREAAGVNPETNFPVLVFSGQGDADFTTAVMEEEDGKVAVLGYGGIHRMLSTMAELVSTNDTNHRRVFSREQDDGDDQKA